MIATALLFALAAATALAQGTAEDQLRRAGELYVAGDIEEAANAFETSAQRLLDEGKLEAAARGFNNACVTQNNLGLLESALENCGQAVDLRRRLDNRFGEARSLNNLALAHQRLGQLEEADRLFREALERNVEIGEEEGAHINRQNLGALAWARGHYDQALAEFRRIEQSAQHLEGAWTAAQVRIARQNQGAVLESLGNDREALAIYLELLEQDDQMSPAEQAPLEYNAAVAYGNLGDPREALQRLEGSRQLYSKVEDSFGVALALSHQGWILHDGLGRSEDGIEVLEQALSLAREIGGVAEQEVVLGFLVDMLVDLGRLDRAEALVNQLSELAEQSEQVNAKWSSAAAAAIVARERGQLDEAIDWILSGVDEVERTGGAVMEARDRARFVRAQSRLYGLAVELLGKGHNQGHTNAFENALQVISRANARDLLSRIGLEQRIAQVTIPNLRRHLDGATLIQYYDSGQELWRFSIAPDGDYALMLDDRDGLVSAADRVGHRFAAGEDPAPTDLTMLADGLLKGLELDGPDSRLVISPVGPLARIPWEVLPWSESDLLLDRAVISYLPSAAFLLEEESNRNSLRRRPWVAVASQGPESARNAVGGPSLGLAPLPHVDDEVRLLTQLSSDGSLLTGSEATSDRVFAELKEPGADIVHLAVHAVVDERPGYGSVLLLDDAAVDPDRIATEKLDVGLAVLAACSTTLGSDPSGVVLQSLTGAWLASGAESVVATLWDVDDQSTLAFMQQFYAQLGRGLDAASALTEAKRRLRSDPAWAGSSSWAAYVLTGVVEQRRAADGRTQAVLVVAGVAILLAVLLIARRRRTAPTG